MPHSGEWCTIDGPPLFCDCVKQLVGIKVVSRCFLPGWFILFWKKLAALQRTIETCYVIFEWTVLPSDDVSIFFNYEYFSKLLNPQSKLHWKWPTLQSTQKYMKRKHNASEGDSSITDNTILETKKKNAIKTFHSTPWFKITAKAIVWYLGQN